MIVQQFTIDNRATLDTVVDWNGGRSGESVGSWVVEEVHGRSKECVE